MPRKFGAIRYGVSFPLPASEFVLFFIVSLAKKGLTPGTIKTYLATVGIQIIEGLPNIQQAFLPCLPLVQSEVQKEHSHRVWSEKKRLPVTLAIFTHLHALWFIPHLSLDDTMHMLWTAGFFRFLLGR